MTSFQQHMRSHADAAGALEALEALEQRYVVAMCWQLKGLFGIRPELAM